jgi:hypothetical protein
MFVYGAAGVGKTMGCIQFPNSYIIDTEKGTDFYAKTIAKSNSAILQTNNPDEIREELKLLLTEIHPYKTLIIDPITQVYHATQEKWTRIFEKYADGSKSKETQDFGVRFWGKVKSDFKSIQRLLMQLDMNVIITAHQKDVYATGMVKTGVSFDSIKGEDYLYDLIFRVERNGENLMAHKIKERAEIGENKFPDSFIWSYDNFCKFYGKEIIEKKSEQVSLATKEQLEKILRLLEVIKIDDEIVTKWFTKADVDSWPEMNNETMQKCIDYLENKLPTT